MTKDEFKELLRSAVKDYIIDEDAYDDNAQLCIKLNTMEVYLADSREVNVDAEDIECYDVMDLVEMDPEGKWKVDEAAVDEVSDVYL
ncbi:MAG: hypothetical protein K2J70_07860 [Muribaculaceae bacterium]|nr:hypothetical protein [Muribaculaceae bacterium]